MLYLIGDKDGKLGQSDSLAHWGYHAGKSSWSGLPGTVSNELVGLELQAAGKLKLEGGKFKTWWGGVVPVEEVKYSRRRGNIESGYYHTYTQAQMELVLDLGVWLWRNDPEVFSIDRVVGHDEVSPGRKSDPGGAFVWDEKALTMNEVRELIWERADRV